MRETTQKEKNTLLYKFENNQKKLVVLGVVDMRQLLLKVEARDVFKTYGNIGCGDCKKGDTKLEIFVTPSK